MGAVQRLTQRAGAARAKEMALLGRRYPAATLERWNIINWVVADEQLDSATMVLAQELAHGPSIANAATKRLVSVAVNEGVAAADEAMAEIQRPIFAFGRLPHRGQVVSRERYRHGRVRGPVSGMPLPLEGIRVVDFSRVLAGPHCAKTLLDLGAEVIKLEPPGGDLSRKAFPSQGEISGYYAQQNAGKRNLSIDLNAPGAREAALRLCDTADVIVENFRPGALASFGLGYESVSARNPGVVYASISGYGQHGPWRSRMAYAPTVQAETGITANTADHFERTDHCAATRSRTPTSTPACTPPSPSWPASPNGRTGQGQYIDVAMAAVMLSINERVHADLSDEDLGDERPILGATDGPFFTGPHGERFASPMSLVGSMSFPFYLAAMRRPDLGRDPRFRTPELRLRNLDALHRIVQEWIWTFADMESLDAQLDEAKIATGQVRSVKEFAASDWAREWDAVRTVSDRSGGEIRIPGRPWHFADQVAADEDQLAARQGEHNAEVLSELGFSAAEIEVLEAAGALVQPMGA